MLMKIGLGALHFDEQPPKALSKNAVHHFGMQFVGLDELYSRMKNEGLNLPSSIRRFGRRVDSGGYFMLEAPDRLLLEVFKPGISKFQAVREYYGFGEVSSQKPKGIGPSRRTDRQISGGCSSLCPPVAAGA